MPTDLVNTLAAGILSLVGTALSAYAAIKAASKKEAVLDVQQGVERGAGPEDEPSRGRQSKWSWIALAIFAGSIVMLLLAFIALQVMKLASSADVVAKDDQFALEADAEGKPYVLASVVSNVQIEDTAGGGKRTRRVYVKTAYVLQVLRDITDGYYDGKSGRKLAFTEEYSTNQYKRFYWWLGTERQEPVSTERNSFNLYFSAKKGQLYTVMTGGTYVYDLPMAKNRLTPDSQPLLDSEDYYMYKNTEDYIKSLLIVVHSRTTNLRLPRRAGFQINGDQPIRSDGISFKDDQPVSNDQNALAARFTYLRPGVSGGVRYNW